MDRKSCENDGSFVDIKCRRTSAINIICRMQRALLFLGGLMFIIWFLVLFSTRSSKRLPYSSVQASYEQCCELNAILPSGRLPNHVVPHHYNITLQAFLPPEFNFTTEGHINILLECLKSTNIIALHARGLQLLSANISSLDYSLSTSANITEYREKQVVTLHLENPLVEGKQYSLSIVFSGIINEYSSGLYRSSYLAHGENASWIASTQFQPSDARRVFPCFDEPGLKSTFQLHIVKKKGTVALSNMPELLTQTLDEFWEVISFKETPLMSTYLLAFVIGDIKPYAVSRHRDIQIWSRSDMTKSGEYAYNVTADILEYLGEYLGVPYEMPKTDLVAVPSFMHAAMENWGLITFAESALLYDPLRSSEESKVFITLVIAHELAHQWFGNLVTPVWWDDLWLSEGFATYYEYFTIDYLRPKWNIMYHFLGSIFEVMETDSLLSTRAISEAVAPSEVLEYFDEITYLKGGAMVRMAEHFLGENNFHKGLKNYLWKYSFKNVKKHYLWQNLNLWNKNDLGVKHIMETWTSQAGYPIVKIDRNYNEGTAVVSQKVFQIGADEVPVLEEDLSVLGDHGKDKRIWIVPITLTNKGELDWSTKTDLWLKSRSTVLKNLPNETTWIIGNVQQVGFYRVNYDVQNWEMLLLQMLDNHTVIHPINRAQILNDALNLARSEDVEYTIALNLTKYLYHEEDLLAWKAAFSAFRYLDLMLSKGEGHEQWKAYVLTLMSPLYNKLGWSNKTAEESLSTKLLRKDILKWSCNYGQYNCVSTAVTLFNEWKKDADNYSIIPVNDREVALCTGISNGTFDDWEFMWNRYIHETFKTEKNVLLRSLACTKEIELLEKLLWRAMNSSSGIPLEDASNVFVYVAENFNGREVVYKFFKTNLEDISLRFESISFARYNIADKVTAPLYAQNEIQELERLLKKRSVFSKSLQLRLKMAIQSVKNNNYWIQNSYGQVFSWLQENPIDNDFE